nr:putative retrotransposon protein [Tanacetum cinerariifolium]
AFKEAVWIRKFFFGLGVVPTNEEPMKMYCNNTGAISIANEPGITKGAKHYRIKVYYLCEVIKLGDIKLDKVHTYDNVADPFTKALPSNEHSSHTKSIDYCMAIPKEYIKMIRDYIWDTRRYDLSADACVIISAAVSLSMAASPFERIAHPQHHIFALDVLMTHPSMNKLTTTTTSSITGRWLWPAFLRSRVDIFGTSEFILSPI